MSGAVSIDLIRDRIELDRLVDDWWCLWRRSGDATPFQSPAWLVPWILEFAPDNFALLTARENDRLAGLLPLAISQDTTKPGASTCGGRITDYQGGIFERDADPSIMGQMFAALRRAPSSEFANLTLNRLRAGSPLLECPVPPGWVENRNFKTHTCPVLALPAHPQRISDWLPKRMAGKLHYYRRRADKAGPVSFLCADSSQAVEFFERVATLHRARWAQRNQSGVLSDKEILSFHRSAIPCLADAGLVRIYLLQIGKRDAAGLYGFIGEDRFYYYIGGYSPDFSKLAAGTLLIDHVIGKAVELGCLTFDFLSGSEPYKYQWGAVDTSVFQRTLVTD
jgi:CelD/BcsL family acetyltransferase involved in cellulose biosynthesis